MMRLQWFAVALMIFGALAVGQTAGALEFTMPVNTPFPGSIHKDNGDGAYNSWAITDGEPYSFAQWIDDDSFTGGMQTHFICDLGRMTTISEVKFVSWKAVFSTTYGGPNSVDFYYFVDGIPYDSDDIENDSNITLAGHVDFPGLKNGASHTTTTLPDFSAQYVGVRVNSGYNPGVCMMGDLYFETPDPAPMESPLVAFHSVGGTNPGNCVDGDFATHAAFADDDAGAEGVQGHVIFDLGEALSVGGMKLKTSRGPSGTINPKDVDFYYFADDVVYDSDDIEGDDNIVLINSHEFSGLIRYSNDRPTGWPEFAEFDDVVEKRYIGMRVNSSFGASDFQMANVELFATGGSPPTPIPGDANNDDIVDDKDASILAAHWQTGPEANWEDGDFNNDGFVNDQDASILAAHWLETREGTAVPEPTTVVMLLGGLLSLWIWRRR